MSDKNDGIVEPVRIAYTGTRAPDVQDSGFVLLHLPMLESDPVEFNPAIIAELLKAEVQVVFFSSKAVSAVSNSPLEKHFDADNVQIWAVGSKTAEAIEDALGVVANVPDRQDFDGICAALERPDTRKIVVFGLEGGPRNLGDALTDRVVHEFPVYRTFPRLYPNLGDVLREFAPDWIAFTSPRGLDAFASQADQFDFAWRDVDTAAIGPTTGDSLREHGLEPRVELDTPGRNRLVRALLDTDPQ
ncbi:MAG: uroporphyrinogen-III synthase [Myxococcota bacterium]